VLVGAVQLNSTEDVERNLEVADRLTRAAVARGAELVLLPEKWSVLGHGEVMLERAEPLDGRCIAWARAVARELGIELIAGSIVERLQGESRAANTSVHIGPDGELRAVYRKLHMFDVQVDGVRYAESDHERAGEEIVLSALADGTRVGMSICYDVRFPELYRALVAAGAQILSIPSAFTLATTRDHWELLLRARAIENQCFVLAANQIGEHARGMRSGGRSMLVDPWGVVLACAPDRECAIVGELDLQRLGDVRRQLPSLAHRRPEVYARPVVVADQATARAALGSPADVAG